MSSQALLTFRLSQQPYALPIPQVLEVASMVSYVKLPTSTDALLGIVNRHGTNLPLVDLCSVFGFPAHQITASSFFIVATIAEQSLGLLVDEILQVRYVSDEKLLPMSEQTDYITHIANDGQNLFQIIDLPALLQLFVQHPNHILEPSE